MKKAIALIACIVVCTVSIAQVTEEWRRSYQDSNNQGITNGETITLDSVGNAYIASSFIAFSGQMAVRKYDPLGNTQWTAFDTNYALNPVDLKVKDNFLYVLASGRQSYERYVLLKYDLNGNEIWSFTAQRDTGVSEDYPTAFDIDEQHNVYITGYSNQSINRWTFTLKVDAAGQLVWADDANQVLVHNAGHQIYVADSNTIYMVGRQGINGNTSNFYIQRYDQNGNVLWSDTYSGGAFSHTNAQTIDVDIAGNIYVGGHIDHGSSNQDDGERVLLFKYDPNGTRLWHDEYGNDFTGFDLLETFIGNDGFIYQVVFGGQQSNNTTMLFMRYDASGTLVNDSAFLWDYMSSGVGLVPMDVAHDANDNIYLTGYDRIQTWEYNWITVKYDSSWAQEWEVIYDSDPIYSSNDQPQAMALDLPRGALYVTGDRENGSLNYCMTIKYCLNPQQVGGITYTSTDSSIFINAVSGLNYEIDYGDSTVLSNVFSHTYTQPGIYNVMVVVSNDCESDTLYATIDFTSLSISGHNISNSVTVYPNPFNEYTTVVFERDDDLPYDFELFNLTGKVVFTQQNIVANSFKLYRGDLAKGVYFYRITSASHPSVIGKIVIH
jgi:hypothetical protein